MLLSWKCAYVWWSDIKVSWNSCRNWGKVQSSSWGETIWEIKSGKWVGCGDKAGLDWRADVNFPLERWSAVVFVAPGRCVAVIVMSKCAMKTHRERRRCITIVSFEEPLLIAATNPLLSHWKLMWRWCSVCPQVTQVNMIGTSSFAMIPTSDHSGSHCHWSQLEPRTAAYPHVPEVSVWATKSGVVKRVGWCKMLKLFQRL